MNDSEMNCIIDAIVASKKNWAIAVRSVDEEVVEIRRVGLETGDSLQQLKTFEKQTLARKNASLFITLLLIQQKAFGEALKREILPIFEFTTGGVRQIDRDLRPIDSSEAGRRPYHC